MRVVGIVLAILAVLFVAMAFYANAMTPSTGTEAGSSPSPVTPPSATATPSPTVTPTPSETAPPPPAEPWSFQGAQFDIPCVGISGPVTEYTEAMLVDGAVEPATMDMIAWYSGIPGGILSEAATNTNYVYGHSWTQPAIFNDVRKMTPGCEVIITTGNGETLTYVMTEPTFPVLKSDLPYDPRINEVKAGRLVLVSCYRPDGYDPNSGTVENVVAILQLVP